MGAKSPWTSEIYLFQGFFRPQRLLTPPHERITNVSPPGKIPEYAPEVG